LPFEATIFSQTAEQVHRDQGTMAILERRLRELARNVLGRYKIAAVCTTIGRDHPILQTAYRVRR
jgi:UDP-N-acetylmuramyl tripeptide synthase